MFKNILVNAMVNLGDVVLTTSALALIKKHFPESKITMLVKSVVADAVKNNPVVDEVILFDYKSKENSIKKMTAMVKEIKRRKFDLSISFDRKLRPALLTYLAGIPRRIGPSKVFDENKSHVTWLYTDVVNIAHDLNRTLQAETYQTIVRQFFNIEGHERPVFAAITPTNKAKVDALFKRLPKAKIKIALCVKGTFPLKTWPKEYFAEVIKNLALRYDVSFFIVGAPNDREYANEVITAIKVYSPDLQIESFCGETTLVDLAEIFKRSDLLITVDTGATHIAATTGVKMVVMYGCTSPDRWHPINDNAVVFTSRESCCPCSVKVEGCPSYPKPKCLHNITAEMITEACCNLLDKV